MVLIALLLVAALVNMGFTPPILSDGHYPPLRLYPEQLAAQAQTQQAPEITASSALMIDLDARQTLYALQPDTPLAPASTAKLMTALLVLQDGRLDDVVTVSANAAGTTGSRMGLTAGEQLTVHDLLWGLLLPSGNDAAVALAEQVAGSEAAFVERMNQMAASMGLAHTHFVNPHGLDADGQTVSAADLAKIATADLAYPAFVEIVGTADKTVAGHALANTNELLGAYPGADGIKTGTTDIAGECLVASASRGGHRVLLVLLHSSDRYGDAKTLFKWANATWAWQPAALPDDALAWQIGADGRSYRLQTAAASDVFLPAWELPLVQEVRALDPTVPLTGTVPVGVLRVTLGDQVLATVPLTTVQGP